MNLIELELQRAAFHEAAHEVILSYFGGVSSAELWRNATESREEKAWLGTTRMYSGPGTIPLSMRPSTAQSIPKNALVIVGLAGLVAEAILSCITEATGHLAESSILHVSNRGELDILVQEEVDDAIASHCASGSDLELMGDFSRKDLSEAISVVCDRWAHIERRAWSLISTVRDSQ